MAGKMCGSAGAQKGQRVLLFAGDTLGDALKGNRTRFASAHERAPIVCIVDCGKLGGADPLSVLELWLTVQTTRPFLGRVAVLNPTEAVMAVCALARAEFGAPIEIFWDKKAAEKWLDQKK